MFLVLLFLVVVHVAVDAVLALVLVLLFVVVDFVVSEFVVDDLWHAAPAHHLTSITNMYQPSTYPVAADNDHVRT